MIKKFSKANQNPFKDQIHYRSYFQQFDRPFARFSESPINKTKGPIKRNKRSTETGEESQRKRPKLDDKTITLKRSLSFGVSKNVLLIHLNLQQKDELLY